jgi:drug/metabolite transporter (DMT)-like permease
MEPKLIGMGAALGSAASWAIGSILFKRIGESVSPFGMTLVKGSVSILLLGAVLMITGYGDVPTNSLLLLCLSGVLGIAIADTLFFAALQDIGPIPLVVFFMMGQLLTALLAIFFLHEMPSIREWIGIILTLSGICTVLGSKISGDDTTRRSGIRGIILGGLSMIAMSSSTIIAKPALMNISTLSATFLRMVAGTIGVLLFGIASGRIQQWLSPVRDMQMMLRFFFSVCTVTFGGFWLSLVAIKYVDVAVASALSATEPLFIIPFAILIFKERVSFAEIIGAVLASGGIILII